MDHHDIRAIREDAGYTRPEICRLLGIHNELWRKWEDEKLPERRPSAGARAFLVALRVMLQSRYRKALLKTFFEQMQTEIQHPTPPPKRSRRR